jgi:hypothetical protein
MANGTNGNGIKARRLLQSRKFVAFLVSEATWKIILAVVLILGIKEASIDVFLGSIALAIIIVAGFGQALYIGGQAGIDKYTQIAQIAANAGHNFQMKGMSVTNGAPKPPELPPQAEEVPPEAVTPEDG